MKISWALLVLLLAAAWAGGQGASFLSSRIECCSKEKFHSRKIPDFRIQAYNYTSPSCTYRAVRVKLPSGFPVCVDPEVKWFKEYLQRQKKPKSTSK